MTRGDLPSGLQAAQAAHAAFQFSLEHPEITRLWHDRSSYLILLSVPNEDALLDWADVVCEHDVPHSIMVEPDLGNEHTSMAVAPSALGRRFSELPLLGRELAST